MLRADVTTRYLLDRAKEHAMLASEDFRVGVRASYRPPDSAHAFANWWGIERLIRGANSLHLTPIPIKAMPASVKSHSELLSTKEAVFLHVRDDQEAEAKSVEACVKDRRRIKKLGRLIKKHASTNDQQPLIVYVDDQLKGGWYEAVHFALSGRSGNYCTPSNWLFRFDGEFPPVDLGDAESSAGKILTLNPRLVVTDLRLKGEDESKNSFENSSGKRLIERLRAKAPALPILLMTASNRADSVQQALRMGVDAYWTKEGIGERSSGDAPERRATDLILLVERLLGDDYNLLRGMDQHLKKFARQWMSEVAPRPCTIILQDSSIADNCHPWWKKHKWGKSAATGPILAETIIDSAEEILGPLRSCMEMYREYLRTFTMFQSALESTEDFWLRSICVQVGRIVEMVHRFDSLDKQSANSSTIKSRRDWLGLVIYEVRNKAAHYSRDCLFTKPFIQLLLLTVLYWLSLCDPRCEALPDDALVRLVDQSGTETVATFQEKAAAFFARPLGDHACTTRDAERLRNGYSR
jgi:CheY-like chemotaxis protein